VTRFGPVARSRCRLVMAAGVVVALSVSFAARGQSVGHDWSDPRSSPIWQEYVRWWRAHPGRRLRSVPPPQGVASVREVSLHRTQLYAEPSFTVRFFADGRVEYIGHRGCDSLGPRTGRIDRSEFLLLAQVVQEIGFRDLATVYSEEATEAPAYLFAVEWSDGTRKLVMDHGFTGPRVLWALGMAMERLLDEVEWDPVPSPTPPVGERAVATPAPGG